MGEWNHPPHYTEAARAFEEEARTRENAYFITTVLPKLRHTARSHGYALALHGTSRRDIDLVAVPWITDAAPGETLLKALAGRCKDETGWGQLEKSDRWSTKPHGRIAATITGSMHVRLDISVMPMLVSPGVKKSLTEDHIGL